jgi:hypothetical protein
VVTVLAHVNGKINAGDVSAAYKSFSEDMLKASINGLTSFTPGEVSSDDGTKLIAYRIADASSPEKLGR